MAGKTIVLMTDSGDCGDDSEYRHIPGTPVSGFHTLCGWCDCPGSETHSIRDLGAPDCPECLAVVKTAIAYKKYAV